MSPFLLLEQIMKTIFVCYASNTEYSFDDYWRTQTDEPEMLIGDTLEELYEYIAAYKINYERPQAPQEKWRIDAKYKNYNDHTDVEFGNILEVVVPDEWDYQEVGTPVTEDLIVNSARWQAKLDKEQAAIDEEKERRRIIAQKAAETKAIKRADAEARADRRRAALDRRKNK